MEEKNKNIKEIYALIQNTFPDAIKVTVTVTNVDGIQVVPEYGHNQDYTIKDICGRWHGKEESSLRTMEIQKHVLEVKDARRS